MFSEKMLIGFSFTDVDDENRLILPKFTHAEAGDRFIVIPEDDRLAIYSSSTLENYIKKLDKIKNTSDKKNLLIELRTIFKNIIIDSVVDNSQRISLSSKLIFNDKNVIVRGSGDRLVLQGNFSYPELYKKRS